MEMWQRCYPKQILEVIDGQGSMLMRQCRWRQKQQYGWGQDSLDMILPHKLVTQWFSNLKLCKVGLHFLAWQFWDRFRWSWSWQREFERILRKTQMVSIVIDAVEVRWWSDRWFNNQMMVSACKYCNVNHNQSKNRTKMRIESFDSVWCFSWWSIRKNKNSAKIWTTLQWKDDLLWKGH